MITMRSMREVASIAMIVVAVTGAVACAAEEEKAESGVVARVGGVEITLTEVDEQARRTSLTPFQAIYDARSVALEAMIEKLLLEQEAVLRGISVDKLVELEITSKTPSVSETDVQEYYAQNQPRMGGRTLEDMTSTILTYLLSTGGDQAHQAFVDSLRMKSNVRVALDPPRAEVIVAANDPSRGPKEAPITIVEYSDFQ